MLNYLKNDLWLDYDMVFHYIALMDLLFTEILPILKSPHKQEFIKEIFINDNKRLFTMI